MKRRRVVKRTKDENEIRYMMKAMLSTQIKNNIGYSKHILDSLIDAQNMYNEIQNYRALQGSIIEKSIPPITSNTIKWISIYFRYLYINGQSKKHIDNIDDIFFYFRDFFKD